MKSCEIYKKESAKSSVARIMVQSDYILHFQNTSFLNFYYDLFKELFKQLITSLKDIRKISLYFISFFFKSVCTSHLWTPVHRDFACSQETRIQQTSILNNQALPAINLLSSKYTYYCAWMSQETHLPAFFHSSYSQRSYICQLIPRHQTTWQETGALTIFLSEQTGRNTRK